MCSHASVSRVPVDGNCNFIKRRRGASFSGTFWDVTHILECRRRRETEKRTKGGKSEMAERRIWQNGKETLKKIFWTTEKEKKKHWTIFIWNAVPTL